MYLTLVSAVASASGGSPAPRPRLLVRLSAADELSATAARALTDEVRRLWTRAGVPVAWTPAAVDSTPQGSGLRVVVMSWTPATLETEHAWPVAALLQDQERQPVAVASLEAARRVIRATGHTDEPASLVERRLGLILGRAVAHEIGHALLGPGHHGRGLMRARIGAWEFADLRDGGFGLDARARDAAVTAVRRLSVPRLALAR